MTNTEFNQVFQKRILGFVVRVFRFMETLPTGTGKSIISYQLGKSASSTGANHRAFCRGRSKNEKFSKVCIAVEEADESEYWLQVIDALHWGEQNERAALLKEIDEILRLLVTIKNSLWESK